MHQEPGRIGATPDGAINPCARLEEAIKAGDLQLAFEPLMSLQQQPATPRYRVSVRVTSTAADSLRNESGFATVISANGTLRMAALRAVVKPSLLVRIDLWTLGKSLQALARHQAVSKDWHLFVPQSMSSVRLKQWLTWTQDRLAGLKLRGENLTLLIDNADLLSSLATASTAFPAMTKLGIGICITDFNAQPASQSLLRDYRIDSLVPRPELVSDKTQRDILTQIIRQAHAQQTSVIAGGVSDAETLSRAWDLGADLITGPFLQSPTSAMNFDFDAT